MKVGEYIRTRDGEIYKITKFDGFNIGIDYDLYSYGYDDYEEQYYFITDSFEYGEVDKHYIIKTNSNILKLLEPMDLLYVDIDGGFEGGIIVPRIPETQNELNEYIEFIKSGHWILKGIVTHGQLKLMEYEVK